MSERLPIPAPNFLKPVATQRAPVEVKTKRRGGRPRLISEALTREICTRIMLQQTLKEICADPNMPSQRTIVYWLADPRNADFREQYYYARRVQAELYVDEIFEIADDTSKDYKKVYNSKTEEYDEVPNNEHIQRSRVRIDTRKWYASKMVPKIYGDKQQIDHDVTGDLAELMKGASNNDEGLPPPIEDNS